MSRTENPGPSLEWCGKVLRLVEGFLLGLSGLAGHAIVLQAVGHFYIPTFSGADAASAFAVTTRWSCQFVLPCLGLARSKCIKHRFCWY